MIILIAPAKKMTSDIPYLDYKSIPVFLDQTRILMHEMKKKTSMELKHILQCSDAIAKETYKVYQQMELTKNMVPAILSYQGIQYQYMAPHVFPDEYFAYVQKHVRILSGFYGVLKPLDGVVPYRLELNNALTVKRSNLYAFWNHLLYDEIVKDTRVILDLASAQYGKIIKRYCGQDVRYITCRFKEDEDGKLREKGVYVKIARGEMVRYLVEIQAEDIEAVKTFKRCGYTYQEALSTEYEFVFVRRNIKKAPSYK